MLGTAEIRQSCNVKMNVLALGQIKKVSLETGKLVKSWEIQASKNESFKYGWQGKKRKGLNQETRQRRKLQGEMTNWNYENR